MKPKPNLNDLNCFQTPKRLSVKTTLPFDYYLRPAQDTPSQLIILLHGFAETGEKIFRKLVPNLPQGATVLAPNGPLPMPYRKNDKWQVTYSWYYYEPGADDYLVDMQTSIESLREGIRQLGLSHLLMRWIGFSQGGYLAPIAAHAVGGAQQVIGIGCEYLVDEIPPSALNTFRVDAIHGVKDETVSLKSAQKSHAKLLAAGVVGEFHSLPETDHSIDLAVCERIQVLLGKV